MFSAADGASPSERAIFSPPYVMSPISAEAKLYSVVPSAPSEAVKSSFAERPMPRRSDISSDTETPPSLSSSTSPPKSCSRISLSEEELSPSPSSGWSSPSPSPSVPPSDEEPKSSVEIHVSNLSIISPKLFISAVKAKPVE